MIRTLGFLTGIVVTGTAVWLLSDGEAVNAALESMTTYLEETASSKPMASPAAEAQPSILPPAAIMRRPDAPRALPAGAPLAETADTVETAAAPIEMSAPLVESTPVTAQSDAPAVEAQAHAQVSPAADDASADAAMAQFPEDDSEIVVAEALMAADPQPLYEDASLSIEDPINPQTDIEQADEPAFAEDGDWFAFWTPFRSRASADGFARHLVQATGQEIRVLRLGPGEYRVAFFHDGEEDRQRHLASLESASGLKLGGDL